MRFGSGVLLVRQLAVVTNAHVVIGPGRIRARLGSRSYSPSEIEVLYVDADADLAVLKLSASSPQGPIIRLRTGGLPDIGERVFAIGNPQGLERTFSEGVISGVRLLKVIGPVLQHTAPISPGSSGGALFDATGQLVGLTVAYLEGGQNLNFAVPSSAVASALDQAFDVPSDGKSLAGFAERTRKRFPGVYDDLDDPSLLSVFRGRYPALGAVIASNNLPAVPPQLRAFVEAVADILDEYNQQAAKVDIQADATRIVELQALNRRRLTRLRVLQPPTAKTRESADLLIAGFEETGRRFDYYTSTSTPTRPPAVDLSLMRNEVQYSSDGFEALLSELMPYKTASRELFEWVAESFSQSRRLLDKLSAASDGAASQQANAPPSIIGTWSDAGGTFANRVTRTPDIEIASRSSGGFVVLFSRRGVVEGINYLLTGNVTSVGSSVTGELTIGFYLSLPGGNEACSRKVNLDFHSSGPNVLAGTARFGNLTDSGVKSEVFRAVCSGLPSGTRQVQLQRIR